MLLTFPLRLRLCDVHMFYFCAGMYEGVWGAPAGLVVGWLFWGRRHEIIHEVKGILGVEDEE